MVTVTVEIDYDPDWEGSRQKALGCARDCVGKGKSIMGFANAEVTKVEFNEQCSLEPACSKS